MFAANTFKLGRFSLGTFFLLFAACFYYSYLFARHGDALPPAAATFVELGKQTRKTTPVGSGGRAYYGFGFSRFPRFERPSAANGIPSRNVGSFSGTDPS